jgi:hypothetical protein
MISISEIIRQLSANAEGIRALLESVPDEQARWKPDPETWSLKETMEHVSNEERIDFRRHLRELLHDPAQTWGSSEPKEYLAAASCSQALESFLAERKDSIAWLRSLKSPDWSLTQQIRFGPEEVMTISAGDVLVSWVAHDHLHFRQLNELLFAWNEQQAAPHSVRYAGGW